MWIFKYIKGGFLDHWLNPLTTNVPIIKKPVSWFVYDGFYMMETLIVKELRYIVVWA